jgi:hypothetical protein
LAIHSDFDQRLISGLGTGETPNVNTTKVGAVVGDSFGFVAGLTSTSARPSFNQQGETAACQTGVIIAHDNTKIHTPNPTGSGASEMSRNL